MAKQTAPCQELQTRQSHEAEPARSTRERIPAEECLQTVASMGAQPKDSVHGSSHAASRFSFAFPLRQAPGFQTGVQCHD